MKVRQIFAVAAVLCMTFVIPSAASAMPWFDAWGLSTSHTMLPGGNDQMWGRDFDDTLHGNDFDDRVYGEVGSDAVYGDVGNDMVYGGDQDDKVYGGTGADFLSGGNGNDLLTSDELDGAVDNLDCGPGFDEAKLRLEDNADNCEVVHWVF